MKCAVCDEPATCVGIYDGDENSNPEPACDTCCGHGCEDGWCVDLEEWKREPMLMLVVNDGQVIDMAQ